MCLLLIVTAFGTVQARGRTSPDLAIGTIHIGSVSRTDAHSILEQEADRFDNQPITLTYGSSKWTPTLSQLGITIDRAAAHHLIDRQFGPGAWIRALFQTVGVPLPSSSAEMPLTIDSSALQVFCADRMRELGLAPVDAELQINGQSLVVTQDQSGYVVSVNQLRGDLLRELHGFTAPTINLAATFSRASVESSTLQPQLDAISTSLSQPLVLYTDTDQWSIAPSQLAQHFVIDSSSGQPSIILNDEAIDTLVTDIAAAADRPAVNVGIDRSGRVDKLRVPVDGIMVNQPSLRTAIVDAIKSSSHEVEIPVFELKAKTSTDKMFAKYGLTDLIATGTSDFSGSDERREANIRRASELIDGTLVAPGKNFSFNVALGPITEEMGFVTAGATEGGIPGTSVGGGVCQISTTVFRAAFLAGFPIVEWWPHAYRSTFYEQGGWVTGLDASIQQDDTSTLEGADFRFTNTTEKWLLIRSSVSPDDIVTVEIYGTNPGWTVTVDDPVYLDTVPTDFTPIYEVDPQLAAGTELEYQPARDGVTVSIHRTVSDGLGTVLIDEDFVAAYQPEGPVYRISSDLAS